MKKITSVALASLFSTALLLASGNASAFGMTSWTQSSHTYQTMFNLFDWMFGSNNESHNVGRAANEAPAPIPGLLALAAAAGGGIMIRRKSRKNKSDDK